MSLSEAASVARERLFAVIAGVILSVLFVVVLQFSGGSQKALVVFPLAAVLLLLAGNFELSLAAMIVCLYVDVHVSFYSSAVALSALLAVSFFVHHRDIAWKEFANPMTVPILVYGLCIVPSFLNATQPGMSLLALWNVAAFLIVLYTTFAELRTYAAIRRMVALYLAVTCANGVVAIAQSVLGENRPLGVAGIMYVDYAALGICVAVAMSAVSQEKPRKLLMLLAGVIAAALILSQTRGIWIAASITLAILVVYLLVYPEMAGLSRRRIIAAATLAALVVAVLGTIAFALNPRIEQRAMELTDSRSNDVDQSGPKINSLITRVFIWDTARNAFLAHPYVGIGVYAFPYSSRHYSTLPKLWYTLFVEGNSPHQTHVAVLSETGVVGMAGYIVFLIAALRSAFQTIRRSTGIQGKKYGLVAAIGLTYCFVSMGFTDAWLWGQGIILLGLVMGMMLANRRISVP